MNSYTTQLKQLLEFTLKQDASDLHIVMGHPPVLRVGGILIPMPDKKKLSAEESKGLSFALMTEEQQQRLLRDKEIDISYNLEGGVRFRVNIFFQENTIAAALRLIPRNIRTIEELNMPPILHKLIEPTQGFVLITGPSSHGKSTTLAAMIDEINHKRSDHIVTIEDPVEYVFEDDKSIIDQREIGQDSLGFAKALRSAFRQDTDVIMVGEMRDPETIFTALTAAETGHLVLATLHTNSASQTIHRIVDTFSGEEQSQVRAQLSTSLLGVVSQRLIPGIDGTLIPVCEIMLNNPAVSNLIRENKIHELPMVIETSKDEGMISLNRSLADFVRENKISLEDALAYSLDPKGLKILLRR